MFTVEWLHVATAAKYPLPPKKWYILLRNYFLKPVIGSSLYNRGKVFNMWWVGLKLHKSIKITQEIIFKKSATFGGKGFFAAVGTIRKTSSLRPFILYCWYLLENAMFNFKGKIMTLCTYAIKFCT